MWNRGLMTVEDKACTCRTHTVHEVPRAQYQRPWWGAISSWARKSDLPEKCGHWERIERPAGGRSSKSPRHQ